MPFDEVPPTELAQRVQATAGQSLFLLVIRPEGVTRIPLPKSGPMHIGRSPNADVFVDDPQISRDHAVLHLGEQLEIEDLGSANGTRLGGERIAERRKTMLAPHQVIDLGSSMLIVQETSALPSKRRLWSHGYFEARLEEECSRGARRKSPFALLRVRVEGEAPKALLEDVLTASLKATDVVACYAIGEYELLLTDTTRARAEKIAEEIRQAIGKGDPDVSVGLASFPIDGTTAEALIAGTSSALRATATASASEELIVRERSMIDLYRIVDRVAQGTISLLLLGETGVGKEVIAELIHHRSPRKKQSFLKLNCAALSEMLMESELFGHEKGAFTGAESAKIGLLEAANGGTVFLDEVGELPASSQAKLLRALEQREILRVGSVKARPIDVRFISATNRDLESEIESGAFRRDLFYRLNGAALQIPPLRERRSEIEPLAERFVENVSRAMNLPPPDLSSRSLDLLRGYSWPGNIRELRNVIERAVLLTTEDSIEPEHLPLDKLSASWSTAQRSAAAHEEASETTPERERILEALDRCAGNQTRAAEVLGVSRRTLAKWLVRHNIPRPRKP